MNEVLTAEEEFIQHGIDAREKRKEHPVFSPGDLVKYMGWSSVVVEHPAKEHFIGIMVDIWVQGRIMKVPIGLLEQEQLK